MDEVRIDRFAAPLDRAYHQRDHTWVRVEDGVARIGMDALGVEIAGDLAQLLLAEPGTRLVHGAEMGSLEAQKFVGPLRAPVCGTVVEVNARALDGPSIVSADPYGDGWLVVVRLDADHDDLADLVSGDAIEAWFAAEVDEQRRQGSVAE